MARLVVTVGGSGEHEEGDVLARAVPGGVALEVVGEVVVAERQEHGHGDARLLGVGVAGHHRAQRAS